MDQGYDVFRNVSAAGLVDLVAIRGDEVLKLDVKHSRVGQRTGAGGKGCNAKEQTKLGIKWLYVLGDRFEIVDPPLPSVGKESRKCVICPKYFRVKIRSTQKTCCNKCRDENIRRKKAAGDLRTLAQRAAGMSVYGLIIFPNESARTRRGLFQNETGGWPWVPSPVLFLDVPDRD
jgi:hypothetical protein